MDRERLRAIQNGRPSEVLMALQLYTRRKPRPNHLCGVQNRFDSSNNFGRQRKVFTTPVHNEADDVSVTIIIPKVLGLNRNRGCAAVSIGVKRHRRERCSWPNDSQRESGPCVKTMLGDRATGLESDQFNGGVFSRCAGIV